jgi:hypothetical protein
MKRYTRIAVGAGILVLLVLVLRTRAQFAQFSQVQRAFPSVQYGEFRASVTAKLGMPNYHAGKCGVIHFPDKNCVTEYVYSHPFVYWFPEYYIVSFSAGDRVIEATKVNRPNGHSWLAP